MIERLRNWWARQQVRAASEDEALDELSEMERGAQEVYEQSKELSEIRVIAGESRAKSAQVDERLKDFQKRVNTETARRLAMARGERPK